MLGSVDRLFSWREKDCKDLAHLVLFLHKIKPKPNNNNFKKNETYCQKLLENSTVSSKVTT